MGFFSFARQSALHNVVLLTHDTPQARQPCTQAVHKGSGYEATLWLTSTAYPHQNLSNNTTLDEVQAWK